MIMKEEERSSERSERFVTKASFVLALVLLLTACGGKKQKEVIPEAEVAHGTFLVDICEEGEVEALNSIQIEAPDIPWRFGGLKISQIVPDGSNVHAGDTVVIFDPSEVQKSIMELG